jgi:methylated-DNA-protein-cysteine methyltransferase-like protein
MFCHLEVLMLSSTRFTEDFAYEVLSVVEEIPEGNVATYGQIARLIGRDKNSRLVARVLSHASNYGDFPCHRVVNHAGRLVPGWLEQGFLLQQEGVELKDPMHVDLKKYQWNC